MSYDNFMTCLTTCLTTMFVNRAPDLQRHNLGLNAAWNMPRIENTGSTLWKPLRSSSGHALDDDDDS